MKKTLYGLTTLALAAAPIATVVSCGEIRSIGQVGIVTNGNPLFDKSYNESIYKGLTEINSNITYKTNVIQVNETKKMVDGYKKIVSQGVNNIIAPGKIHESYIESFNAEFELSRPEDVSADEYLNKTNFILLDGVVDAPNVASIDFKVQEAAFLAGVMTSIYLSDEEDINPTIGMFGGDDSEGVTDYLIGFTNGVKFYNEFYKSSSDKTVLFAKFSNDDDYTNSGFSSNKTGLEKTQLLIERGADVILPVAGSQTGEVISAINLSGRDDIKIVGVESDQADIYDQYSDMFITSVIKDLQKIVVDISSILMGHHVIGVNGLGETTNADIESGLIYLDRTHKSLTWLYDEINDPAWLSAASLISISETWNTWDIALNYISTVVATDPEVEEDISPESPEETVPTPE